METKKSVLRVLNQKGDQALATWTPGVKTEEDEAQVEFDKLAKQGYLMFSVEAPGRAKEQVRSFDPKAYEIVAVPQFQGG